MKLNVAKGLFTTKDFTKHTAESKTVFDCVQRLVDNGLISAGSGWCVSMSDIIQSQLKSLGIQSKVVEVSLEIQYKEDKIDHVYVGYDGMSKKDDSTADTHVAVVTQTLPPILIDGSIAHNLPLGKLAVVEEITEVPLSSRHPIVIEFPSHNMILTYKEKLNPKIPLTHQMSILQRMETDQKIFKSLNWLRTMIIIAITISILNAARGLYDFYLVYIDVNHWGPDSVKTLLEKVENIEKEVKKNPK